tara:strand:- start:2073 stop:3680 length:1608 start_codon:yes stop_codon:yes gene_type:complete
MSLQLAAKHLSNQGRGPDDTLVHMSRGEVKSLNDLAMAHGGHLTINPETGLPEAGFLSMILPMVAGAALGPAGFGIASSALTAGMMVGAGSYLLNPKAGLMGALSAGLGGYGGAGLASGLSDIATSEAGATIQNAGTEGAKQELARQAADQAAGATDMSLGQAGAANAKAELAKSQILDKAVDKFGPQYDLTPDVPKSAYNSAVPVAPATPATPIGQTQPPLTADQLSTIKNNIISEQLAANPPPTGLEAMYKGAKSIVTDPTADKFKTLGGGSYSGLARTGLAAATPIASEGLKTAGLNVPTTQQKQQVVPHYRFSPGMVSPTPAAGATGTENTYFKPSYTALSDADAASLYPGYPAAQAANGGIMGYAPGGDIQEDPYRTTPDDSLETAYAKAEEKNDTATMRAIEREMEIRDTNKAGMTKGLSGMKGLAMGGLSDARYNLGGYSDGGRLLRGPGDGVSDSIPAMIGKKQPARLADGEFVVPARIVSEIGNGSTEAGARKLYAMMDRIQAARGKTVGKGKIAKNTRADKYLPA